MTEPAATRTFDDLAALAAGIGRSLVDRNERVAVAESSTGGLISAALLTVPGASAFYLGGSVIYTGPARRFLFQRGDLPEGTRGATEDYAERLSIAVAGKLDASWGVAETGATGPAPNPYGDPPGHSWVAVAGQNGSPATRVVATGDDDRSANMFRFAAAALDLLAEQLAAAG